MCLALADRVGHLAPSVLLYHCLQSIENVREADPCYICSKEFTISNRFNNHQHTEHKKGLFIASLNINASLNIRRHLNKISSFLGEKGIHVLALNEAKMDNSYPKQVGHEYFRASTGRKDRTAHGGGVALYIREPIQYNRNTDLPYQDLEPICVEIQPPKTFFYCLDVNGK